MKLFKRQLNCIDLLPESVQVKKLHRRRIFILAAAQVAIFLCLGMAAISANALERQAWDESHRLAARISDLRQNQAATEAAYTRDIARRIAAEEAFIDANTPAEFNPEWLAAVLAADDGYMTTMDYSRGFILLTGMVDDMNKIETHRQSLLAADVFLYVRIGRIAMQDCGNFLYELRLDIW